jgi:hypothetical protein
VKQPVPMSAHSGNNCVPGKEKGNSIPRGRSHQHRVWFIWFGNQSLRTISPSTKDCRRAIRAAKLTSRSTRGLHGGRDMAMVEWKAAAVVAAAAVAGGEETDADADSKDWVAASRSTKNGQVCLWSSALWRGGGGHWLDKYGSRVRVQRTACGITCPCLYEYSYQYSTGLGNCFIRLLGFSIRSFHGARLDVWRSKAFTPCGTG